ncbi:MAG: hypothetical protein EOP06_10595, partial [Proteobacteria bacterium]
MKEFSRFYGEDWEISGRIATYMPLVKKIKRAVSGGDQNTITAQELKSFSLLGVRGYIQYLRYFYFIQSPRTEGKEPASNIKVEYVARSLEDLFGAFQDLLEAKPSDPSCGSELDRSGQSREVSCISKADISEILTSFSDVWKEFRVSPKLINESMKIKKVYLGGSTDRVTSTDFKRGRSKIAGLEQIIEKFIPYYPVFTKDWDPKANDETEGRKFFAEAITSLHEGFGQMGMLFEDSYDLDNLVVLFTEIDALYPEKVSSSETRASAVKKYLPLFKDTKNVIFSDKDSQIKKDQWTPFLKYTARIYGGYLYYQYYLEHDHIGTSSFLTSFRYLSEQLLNLTKDVLLTKNNQTITTAEVQLLARRLNDLGILPADLSTNSIEQLVDLLLNRVMWPVELRLKGTEARGITPVSVENLRRELQMWYEVERFSLAATASPLRPNDFKSSVDRASKDSSSSRILREGLTELSLLISGPIAQTVDSRDRLVISNVTRQNYDRSSVSQLNMNRALTRVTIRATSGSLSRVQNHQGVTLPEAQNVFRKVRPLLVQLKLLSPDNATFIDARFREANIFTAHATGDNIVNFAELGDEVGLIFSAMKINNGFREDLEKKCLKRHAKITPETVIGVECLKQVYFRNVEDDLRSMPEFVKFFRKTDREQFEVFFDNIIKSACAIPSESGVIKLSESDLIPHVIQYVEMVMARIDT